MRFIISLLFYLVLTLSSLEAQYEVGKSYYGQDSFIEYISGNMPIIIVAPHGGRLEPDSLPIVANRGRDNGTLDLSYLLLDSLKKATEGCYPHIIINHIHPKLLNAARNKLEAAGSHPAAQMAFDEFHAFIDDAKKEVTEQWGSGHYFELHGNGRTDQRNEIGIGVSKYQLIQPDSELYARADLSTVKNLASNGNADFVEVLRGQTSLGGILDSLGWKSMPSPKYPSPDTAEGFFYAGWNTWEHGSRYKGTIDATHIESHWSFMTGSNKLTYAGDLSHAILRFMKVHYKVEPNCNPLLVNDIAKPTAAIVYPNPQVIAGVFHFSKPEMIDEFVIYNVMGELVAYVTHEKGFKLSPQNEGVYMVHIHFTDGSYQSQRIVLSK